MKNVSYITADISHTLNLDEQFSYLSEITEREPHLLPQTAESLKKQFNNGLSVIAISDGILIGHTTLLLLTTDPEPFYEVGTTWVHEDWRGKGINTEMYVRLFALHRNKNILGTTTNPASMRVGVHLDMIAVPRRSLPYPVWNSSCICPPEKTGSDNPHSCSHAWTEHQCGDVPCVFRVTKETAERYGLSGISLPE